MAGSQKCRGGFKFYPSYGSAEHPPPTWRLLSVIKKQPVRLISGCLTRCLEVLTPSSLTSSLTKRRRKITDMSFSRFPGPERNFFKTVRAGGSNTTTELQNSG